MPWGTLTLRLGCPSCAGAGALAEAALGFWPHVLSAAGLGVFHRHCTGKCPLLHKLGLSPPRRGPSSLSQQRAPGTLCPAALTTDHWLLTTDHCTSRSPCVSRTSRSGRRARSRTKGKGRERKGGRRQGLTGAALSPCRHPSRSWGSSTSPSATPPTARPSRRLRRCWTCLCPATSDPGATATSAPSRRAAPRKTTRALSAPSPRRPRAASAAAGPCPPTVSAAACGDRGDGCHCLGVVEHVRHWAGVPASPAVVVHDFGGVWELAVCPRGWAAAGCGCWNGRWALGAGSKEV